MAMLSLVLLLSIERLSVGQASLGPTVDTTGRTSRESCPPEHGSEQYFFSMFLEEPLLASQLESLG